MIETIIFHFVEGFVDDTQLAMSGAADTHFVVCGMVLNVLAFKLNR